MTNPSPPLAMGWRDNYSGSGCNGCIDRNSGVNLMSPDTASARYLVTRLAGFLFCAGLYVLVFGDGAGGLFLTGNAKAVADDAAPKTAADGDAVLPDRTAELQQWVDGPSRPGHEKLTGLTVYRITKPIVVDLDKTGPFSLQGDGRLRIVMDGPGPAIRVLGTHDGTAAPRTVKPNVWERQRTPTIDGIEIVGTHPEACGIELNGTMQATITRVCVRRCLHAIHVIKRNRNILIADCHLYENRGVGVFLDDVDLHQINVTGSHISYNDGGGVVSRKGNVRNLHITGCDIESNHGEQSPPTANVLIDCRDSVHGTAEVAITGCTIQHNSTSPSSANIRFIGRGQDPKNPEEIRRWGHLTITGNVLSDVSTNIHLKDCRGATVQGNTLWMGFEHNLLIEDCTDIVFGLNNLDRNPGYAYGKSLTAKNAAVFRNCADCIIDGLHVNNVWKAEAGVVFERCRWLNISNCNIFECDEVGLLLRDCEHCQVTNCMIRDLRPMAEDFVAIREIGGRENVLAGSSLIRGPVERNVGQ